MRPFFSEITKICSDCHKNTRLSRIVTPRITGKKRRYNYQKGPDDPTYISSERASYIYKVKQHELDMLRKIFLRTAHSSDGGKMVCYFEKDVHSLCLSLGRNPRIYELEKGEIESQSVPNLNHNYILSTAILANVTIFVAKASVYYVTGSASMLAECFHSFIDIMNQVILYFGAVYSTKAPTAEHPYGWGRARHISGLISSVSALSAGTTLSITDGVYTLVQGSQLQSLSAAFSVLGLSFVLESFSLMVATNSIAKDFRSKRKTSLCSKEFLEYLRWAADPITVAILMEDLVAIVGVGIAFACILLSHLYTSSVPDSVGCILIGVLLGLSAIALTKRNINFLLERSISRSRLETIVDTIDGDKLVRSVHDVKATMMGNGTVKFKAEINYDGAELAKAYLFRKNAAHLLKRVKTIKTRRQLNKFIMRQTIGVMNCLGEENDRLEKKLKNNFPELRHIDLETL